MQAERIKALDAFDLARIGNLERKIRFLMSLRQQANLEADAYYELAQTADSNGDACRAMTYLEYAVAKKPGHVLATAALAEHDPVRSNS